ncbi:MAG: TlpA family protein disulfide reductase [Polyangiaceae bacterium]|nr:TlpA family protein disulfide reductase [Polyangiaceae bacterium]
MPAVIAVARRFEARGLRVMGITNSGETTDERTEILDAVREEKMTWPSLLDPTTTWWNAADLGAAPTFLVVNPTGHIVFRHTGKLTENTEAFAALSQAIESAW